MKKYVSFLLALSVVFSMTVSAFASESVENHEYVINPNGTRSTVTIEEIDQLIQQKNDALYDEDYETANQLKEKLYQLGGRPSTTEEIRSLSEDGLIRATAS